LLALCALVALPTLASGQDLGSLFDETEPQTAIGKVKASKKGTVKVYFSGSDPVDAPEDLSYDCELDGGDQGADGEDEDDGFDDEDEFHAARDKDDGQAGDKDDGETEVDCPSPWVLKDVGPGRHTVEVIAFDEEFNEDSTPATAQFKVKKR